MMEPLDLIIWAGAFAFAVIVVALALGLSWAIIKGARGKKAGGDKDDQSTNPKR